MLKLRQDRYSQVALVVKNPPANAEDKRHRFHPWVKKIPWRRAWQPTPVFLSGESHGERSLAGHSPWGHKESDMTEVTAHTHKTNHTKTLATKHRLYAFILRITAGRSCCFQYSVLNAFGNSAAAACRCCCCYCCCLATSAVSDSV